MQIRRLLFAATLAAAGLNTRSQAQDWPPSAAVRVIVPFAAGGPVDVPSRLMNERLSAQTKGTFILENRGGAGGTIGAQQVAQAAPDGQTLLFTTSSLAIAPALYANLPFDPLQFTAISLIAEVPIVLTVRGNSPIRTLAEYIAKAKAEPGKITFGSGGVGTGNHLSGELLKILAGINLLHVPFRGMAPGMAALYAGDIDSAFSSTTEVLGPAREGRFACSASARPSGCPNCRTCRRSPSWCRAMRWPTGTGCSVRTACRPRSCSGSSASLPRCRATRRWSSVPQPPASN